MWKNRENSQFSDHVTRISLTKDWKIRLLLSKDRLPRKYCANVVFGETGVQQYSWPKDHETDYVNEMIISTLIDRRDDVF